nr:unnamed protein product [Callosobruchus analis]
MIFNCSFIIMLRLSRLPQPPVTSMGAVLPVLRVG